MKKYLLKISAISIIVILLALLFEAVILQVMDKNSSSRLTETMNSQVKDIITSNKIVSEEVYASVKEDYKIRSQAVAYIIDSKPYVENDIFELKKISALLSIDEINIFNDKGKIISGSVPKYFGLTLDSGDQMSFFKPLLKDKNLSMCQDVTPNTSEGKNMMYAMTWNKNGTKMIQIGIEPDRLMEVLEHTQVDSILKEMPVENGLQVIVSDFNTGRILGSNPDIPGTEYIKELGITVNSHISDSIASKIISINGNRFYTSISKTDDMVVFVLSDSKKHTFFFLITMLVFFVYLGIAALSVSLLLLSRFKADNEKLEQFKVLSTMSRIYYSMHLVDLEAGTVTDYSKNGLESVNTDNKTKTTEMMQEILESSVSEEYEAKMFAFTDVLTLSERLIEQRIITMDFRGLSGKWYKASFVKIEETENHKTRKAIFTIRDIDEEKRRERELFHKSTTDELTDLLNRRAYEDDLKKINLKSDFYYIAFDINELKKTNDTIGHDAGDELIKSAAYFMKKCFIREGAIYRTGGDEFAAIIRTQPEKLASITASFDKLVSEWKGNLVQSLAVSYGIVSSHEKSWISIYEIAKEADKRMYNSKNLYYIRTGKDRRTR